MHKQPLLPDEIAVWSGSSTKNDGDIELDTSAATLHVSDDFGPEQSVDYIDLRSMVWLGKARSG